MTHKQHPIGSGFAATSPLLADIGGVYLKDNDISRLDDEPRQLTADSIPSEVASHSIDPASARRLWDLSERLLKPNGASARGLRSDRGLSDAS